VVLVLVLDEDGSKDLAYNASVIYLFCSKSFWHVGWPCPFVWRWPGGVIVKALVGLRLRKSRVRPLTVPYTNDLGQVVHPMCLCHQTVPVAVTCSWEGNRRSGVALAMCHRRKWFIAGIIRRRHGHGHGHRH